MSTQYPYLYKSNFPDGLDVMTEMTDPTEADLPKIEAYNAKIAANDLAGAQQVLAQYPELKNMMFDANRWNSLYHMTYSVQEFFHDNIDDYLENLITYQGTYSSSKQYTKYDVVLYQGMTYMATKKTIPTGTLPTNTTYFVPMTIKGEKGDPGANLKFCGHWDASTSYVKDDLIDYNNILWAATAANTNSVPSFSNSNWSKVVNSRQTIISSSQPEAESQEIGDMWYKIVE